jgi:carotenoid cleavage dioxygenase-like enzyme
MRIVRGLFLLLLSTLAVVAVMIVGVVHGWHTNPVIRYYFTPPSRTASLSSLSSLSFRCRTSALLPQRQRWATTSTTSTSATATATATTSPRTEVVERTGSVERQSSSSFIKEEVVEGVNENKDRKNKKDDDDNEDGDSVHDDMAARVWRQVATSPDPMVHDHTILSLSSSSSSSSLSSSSRSSPPFHPRLHGLVGTYYVNGLASCQIGGTHSKDNNGSSSSNSRLIHPFESHGFLKAIELRFQEDVSSLSSSSSVSSSVSSSASSSASSSSSSSTTTISTTTTTATSIPYVTLTAQYVNTPVRKMEKHFQRPLFRGAMSTISNTTASIWNQLINAMSPTSRETANLAVRVWPPPLSSSSSSSSSLLSLPPNMSSSFSTSSAATTTTTNTLSSISSVSKLFVSADNNRFYAMDPFSLQTLGVEYMKKNSLQNYPNMLAHTRVDARQQRLVTCAIQYQPFQQSTILTFHEFDQDGELAIGEISQYCISPAVVLHDWSLTENYYVIPAAVVTFDMSQISNLVWGKSTATDLFTINHSSPATCYLFPRPGTAVYQHDPRPIHAMMNNQRHGVVFHMGPAYEKLLINNNTVSALSNDPMNIDHHSGSSSSSSRHIVEVFPFVFDRYQFGNEMGFQLHEQQFTPTPWSIENGGPRLEKWNIEFSSENDDHNDSNIQQPRNNFRSAMITSIPLPQQNRRVIADMPTFHPQCDGGGSPARYVYTVCGIRNQGWFPFNAVAKHDLSTGSAEIWPKEAAAMINDNIPWDGGSCVWAEPLFVPRQQQLHHQQQQQQQQQQSNGLELDEDDGWVISTIHDTSNNTTSLAIFDARNFGMGPIETIRLANELWGWNIHSTFVPAFATKTSEVVDTKTRFPFFD